MKTKSLLSCFDANYLPGGRALLGGIRRFHPEVRRYAMVPSEQVATLQAALGDLAEVIEIPRQLEGVPESFQPSTARVFAAQLPEDVVAYMDADVCICRPLPELWEVPRGKVNVVRDVSTRVLDNLADDLKETFAIQFPEVSIVKGFNSGMFALEPTEWSDLPERFEAALTMGGYSRYPLDQPILNALMYSRANFLPAVFNAHNPFGTPIPPDVRAVHWTCRVKPWMVTFPKHEPSYYYWQKYGMMRENVLYLGFLRLNSAIQMQGRALRRRIARSSASDLGGVLLKRMEP